MGSKSNTVYEYWCDMCQAPIDGKKQVVPYYHWPSDPYMNVSCTHQRIDLCEACKKRPISDLLAYIKTKLGAA